MEHDEPVVVPVNECGEEASSIAETRCGPAELEASCERLEPTSAAINRILAQAAELGQSGVVALHLVAAILDIRFPMTLIPVERQKNEGGIGHIQFGDTVFYVSGSEEIGLTNLCLPSIQQGLRVYVLVPDEKLIETQENMTPFERERIAADSVESFVGRMLDAGREFDGKKIVDGFRQLLAVYNSRVFRAEAGEGILFHLPGAREARQSANEAMHEAADVVARRLEEIFQPDVIEQFDCEAVLDAGEEWFSDEDADVAVLRRAIRACELSES